MSNIIPQSCSAELSARRTAASAVLGDFRRESRTAISSATYDLPAWIGYALRLAEELGNILAALDVIEGGAAAERPEAVLSEVASGYSAEHRLDAGTLHTLAQIIEDAVDYRESHLDAPCAACEAADTEICDPHAGHLDLADRYRDLAGRLGIVVPE